MRLLLDTHVWLWSHLEPEQLARSAVRALEDQANQLWLSPISLWELLMLEERGRVQLECSVGSWIERALESAPMNDAPLTREVALATREIRLGHRDPADRFLAATARVFDLTLLTADQRLLDGQGFAVMASR